MIQAGVISLLVLVCVSSVTSQQTATAEDVLTVPGVVLERSDANVCPSMEMRQEARQNLSAAVRDAISGFFNTIPQCGPGKWKQVINIDMSDPTQQCPSPWQEYSSPARSCGRPTPSNGGCSQVSFSIDSEYSRVCGRATGLETGTADGFTTHEPRNDENYVDGLILTYSSPQQHIWTFAADQPRNAEFCPCSGNTPIPDFVGDNYFCDASANGALWDGEECVAYLSCCNFNSPPWFTVQLPQVTSDAIDARLCDDEGTANELTAVQEIQLYIQ